MTGKERVLAAVEHREPDRVPVDFGSTGVTGIHVSCVAALREYFGLERHPVKVHEPYTLSGWIDDDLKDALGIDTTGVFPRKTMFGFANEGWKPWSYAGIDVLVPRDFNTTVDENGDTFLYPEGDLAAPPSGRMPRGGFFFDTIVRQKPFDEDDPRLEDNLEEFGPIAQDDLDHLRREANLAAAERCVVATFGGMAFGDIALVPAPFLKDPKGIRDIAEWYMSIRTRREFIRRIFDRQCDIALHNLEAIFREVGNTPDVVFICGTDFGTQASSFCSEKTFRELYYPYYKRLNDWIHRHTTWKTFKHSCGSVERFIPAFIEAGFDILNPVQCSAAHMEAERLKEKFGARLAFWGGGIDTQKVLPFGTAAEVREQVLRRCEVFAKCGGFVFNSIHIVQARTPVENIVAMFDAVREFNSQGA